MSEKIVVVDLPTLRLDWIEPEMPRLAALSKPWHRAPIEPVFPGLTCPSQATLTTGAAPSTHGLVANAVFDRATRAPEFWVFHDDQIQARRIWEDFGAAGKKTGVFFFLNINQAKADAILLPKPIHKDDGSMEMWCYHKPDGLYPKLVKTMGHFNLLKFWGPMAGIDSSKWIAEAARRTILEESLDLSFIYLPHTDYAPQKFGPDSDANRKAHRELDGVLGALLESLSEAIPGLKIVVASEYGITDVTRSIAPNLKLREAGLLAIKTDGGREYIDYPNSPAFAMVDHQICHIYCAKADAARVADLFRGEPSVDAVVADPAECGLAHPRSGEVILLAKRDAWFSYPWWTDFAVSPTWAKTMDIHNKPGYDPCEMFWDASINGISQDTTLIKGSHGAPARDADQKAAILSNLPGIELAASTAGICEAIKARL